MILCSSYNVFPYIQMISHPDTAIEIFSQKSIQCERDYLPNKTSINLCNITVVINFREKFCKLRSTSIYFINSLSIRFGYVQKMHNHLHYFRLLIYGEIVYCASEQCYQVLLSLGKSRDLSTAKLSLRSEYYIQRTRLSARLLNGVLCREIVRCSSRNGTVSKRICQRVELSSFCVSNQILRIEKHKFFKAKNSKTHSFSHQMIVPFCLGAVVNQ